jgi:pimeloyl-ACP methyl ester carboxylesterase
MKALRLLGWWFLALMSLSVLTPIAVWAGTSWPVEGYVAVNGVHLQYLDWGGTGPTVILIHGLGDNPHVFDDFAPAFTDHFHVIAYARRGSGNSDVTGPYDIVTLTEDLRELMDALGVAKADLVGYSAAGEEVTEMAAEHPERVGHVVYFDGGYDWADPDFKAAVKALPVGFFDPPPSAMVSMDAFRSYLKSTMYPGLDDMSRIEANLRAKVVIQSDGRLIYRAPRALVDALYSAVWTNKRLDYSQVHCPALALYAEHLYDLQIADAQRRKALVAYEQRYWKPYQAKSVEKLRGELADVRIVRVPGAHSSFFMTDRQQVISSMRRFLDESGPVQPKMSR